MCCLTHAYAVCIVVYDDHSVVSIKKICLVVDIVKFWGCSSCLFTAPLNSGLFSSLPSMWHWLHVSKRFVILICFCLTLSSGSEVLSASICQQSRCHFVCISVCRLIPRAFISCRSTAPSPMPSQVETCDWQQTGWGSILEAVLKLTSVMRK